MASQREIAALEVYTSNEPAMAKEIQYKGKLLDSKVKSRNMFSDMKSILAVVVLISLLVILSKFGAFCSNGSTTTIVKHDYTYIFPNGTKITSDHEQPNISKSVEQSQAKDTVLLGTTPSTTVTVTSTTTAMPDYDGPGK